MGRRPGLSQGPGRNFRIDEQDDRTRSEAERLRHLSRHDQRSDQDRRRLGVGNDEVDLHHAGRRQRTEIGLPWPLRRQVHPRKRRVEILAARSAGGYPGSLEDGCGDHSPVHG